MVGLNGLFMTEFNQETVFLQRCEIDLRRLHQMNRYETIVIRLYAGFVLLAITEKLNSQITCAAKPFSNHLGKVQKTCSKSDTTAHGVSRKISDVSVKVPSHNFRSCRLITSLNQGQCRSIRHCFPIQTTRESNYVGTINFYPRTAS